MTHRGSRSSRGSSLIQVSLAGTRPLLLFVVRIVSNDNAIAQELPFSDTIARFATFNAIHPEATHLSHTTPSFPLYPPAKNHAFAPHTFEQPLADMASLVGFFVQILVWPKVWSRLRHGVPLEVRAMEHVIQTTKQGEEIAVIAREGWQGSILVWRGGDMIYRWYNFQTPIPLLPPGNAEAVLRVLDAFGREEFLMKRAAS